MQKPKVSIIVLAYNHLKYTKLCIDSLFKYTSHIDYELITVNNGSSDGTKEYFDTLMNTKKINLKNNVGVMGGFNTGIKAAEGKYTVIICNDTILTENWLDNLLKCIESDDKIGVVVPSSTNVSYAQQINFESEELNEIQEFAKKYNISDSRKWEQRLRMIPIVSIYPTELFKKVGIYDEKFYSGEFGDDDFSFRVRRAGYKIIFARDTFVYHFGSITVKNEYGNKMAATIQKGREIFFDKYKIDSWDSTTFDTTIANNIYNEGKKDIKILGINAKCGANLLQIRNRLVEKDVENISIVNFTEESKYIVDLKTVSDYVIYGSIDDLNMIFKDRKFDYIVIEKNIEEYQKVELLLENIKGILNVDGQLFFSLNDYSKQDDIIEMLGKKNNI